MKRMMLFSLLAAVCLLAGCGSTKVQDPRIIIDGSVSRYIDVDNVRCFKNESGFPVFYADVTSLYRKELAIEWKVQWLDANGIEIESAVSTWQKNAIASHDIKGIRNVAPSKEAVTMRVYIRKLNK